MSPEDSTPKKFPSYSLSIANFLSSFGGGMILGKAMGLLQNVSYLKGDSLLAYLMGTTLGLILMKTSGKSKLLARFTKYSICSAGSSSILLVLLTYSHEQITTTGYLPLLFFLALVIRFGFWFLARIVRVDIAAGVNRNLAWTEFSYYIGAIFGLIIWPLWTSATLSSLLYVDITALIIAAILDRYSFQRLRIFLKDSPLLKSSGQVPLTLFVSFAGFVVCLTIATQIVEFGFATFSVEFFKNGNQFGSNIVAAGYIGAAISAFFLGKIPVEYNEARKVLGLGTIVMPRISFSLVSAGIVCFLALYAAFVIPFYSFMYSKVLCLIMFALSALIYDLIVLVTLDKLGAVAKALGDVGIIANIYAYMGAIGTLFMLIFVQTFTNKFDFIFISLLFFIIGYSFLKFSKKKTT